MNPERRASVAFWLAQQSTTPQCTNSGTLPGMCSTYLMMGTYTNGYCVCVCPFSVQENGGTSECYTGLQFCKQDSMGFLWASKWYASPSSAMPNEPSVTRGNSVCIIVLQNIFLLLERRLVFLPNLETFDCLDESLPIDFTFSSCFSNHS